MNKVDYLAYAGQVRRDEVRGLVILCLANIGLWVYVISGWINHLT